VVQPQQNNSYYFLFQIPWMTFTFFFNKYLTLFAHLLIQLTYLQIKTFFLTHMT
jgi:hypothetical protein